MTNLEVKEKYDKRTIVLSLHETIYVGKCTVILPKDEDFFDSLRIKIEDAYGSTIELATWITDYIVEGNQHIKITTN